MHVVRIIESRTWRRDDGATASTYGACPWPCESERSRWSINTDGWTLEMSDGTIGFGRPAFATFPEAVAAANEINSRRCQAYARHAERFPETADKCRSSIDAIPIFCDTGRIV